MIWADKEGNIGWQAVGIAPVRTNFSGLVPVPGDGRYEWDGYLPIIQKPNVFNPEKGFFASANQNVIPVDYEFWDAIGFSWSDPYRGDRVNEVLGSGKRLSMEDLINLQVDYLSIPARKLVPLIENISMEGKYKEARNKLTGWDFKLDPGSIEAAIYVAWENQLRQSATSNFVPKEGKGLINNIQMKKLVDWITSADNRFGDDPIKGRDQFLKEAFYKGIDYLKETLGDDINNWQYGQEKFKHSYMIHSLGNNVQEELKSKLNIGPLPRGGNAYTPGSTGNNNRQSSGASFRLIVNTGDWDAAVGTNAPGQSGNPESPFYSNLFEPWAKDQFFPVYYSRNKIESVMVNITILIPKN